MNTKMHKWLLGTLLVAAVLAALIFFTACTEAERVNYNVNQEADNFNVTRRIVVTNVLTDKVIYEVVGNFSLSNNSANELVITCELADGTYKKNYVYLNQFTTYIMEDLSGSDVEKYHYEFNVLPQTLQTWSITYNP